MTNTTISACSSCGRTTPALTLRPSGTSFNAHKTIEDGDERCTGGKPVEQKAPEPLATRLPGEKAKCVECGETQPALKADGKVKKHQDPETLRTCEQRSDVSVPCPICKRAVARRYGKVAGHKDLAKNNRCPAGNKTLAEARMVTVEVKAKPAPKPRSADADAYRALSGAGKSKLKAERLAKELAGYEHPWRASYATDDGHIELTLSRGTGAGKEQMHISWFDGACIGGDGKIIHTFRGRTIAVRNANAVRQRGQMTPEAIVAEFNRVGSRKTTGKRGPRITKTTEELQHLLPFDPATADDATILAAVLGKQLTWENQTSGKREDDVVKAAAKIAVTKAGMRNLSFRGVKTSRTIRLTNLVAVG